MKSPQAFKQLDVHFLASLQAAGLRHFRAFLHLEARYDNRNNTVMDKRESPTALTPYDQE